MANREIQFTSTSAGPFYAFPASEADFTDWLTLRVACDDADDRWTVTLDDDDDWYIFDGASAPTSWDANEVFVDFELQRTLGATAISTGARTVTITVTVESVATQGAKVRVTKGLESYLQTSNVSGVVTFNLDDGTWVVAITSSGATFAGASLVVDGTETVTYDMDALNLTPSDPDRVTAYYLCLDENGDPEEGVEVTLRAKEALQSLGVVDGFALADAARTVESDEDGIASFINVLPGCVYVVQCSGRKEFLVEIPSDADDPFPLRSIVR